ncbi:amidohydrolase [Microbacterium sp.]|jgi:predicted amidohydrolase YtcJ|uniref:amidohydrolase n=1 Tax=Microbacterium sp. TaxID=51671 RepID=UPI0037CBBD55
MTSGSYALVGRTITMAGSVDAKAVIITDGRIAAVGGDDVLATAEAAGLPTERLPAGHVLMPGFVDAHVHFEGIATGRGRGIDCRVPGIRTIPELLERLSEGLAAGRTSGGWLIGYGNLFFDQKLAEHRLPRRDELDSVSTRVPIVVHCGGHTSVLNTPALELAEAERFLSGAAGLWGAPVIGIGADGHPSGVVSEIDRLLPISEPDPSEHETHLRVGFGELFTRYGVTTIGEMAESHQSVGVLDGLLSRGEIAGRIAAYALAPSFLPLQEASRWAADFSSTAGRDRFHFAGVKMFADGGYSSRNAATRQAYVAEHAPRRGYAGQLNLTRARVAEAVRATREQGVRLAVHGNGTRAQDEILAGVMGAGGALENPPVRVEHLGNVMGARTDVAAWREANVIPVMQPGFLYNFIGDFVPLLLGTPGTSGRMATKTVLEEGVTPVFTSDVALGAEEGGSNPLFNIWCAVARRSYWNLHIEPEESISVAQALRLYTIEGARALGMDDRIGSIEVGKLADIVVLDRDPRAVEVDDLPNIAVERVIVEGDRVFSGDAEGAQS